jgi:hypothetical protein
MSQLDILRLIFIHICNVLENNFLNAFTHGVICLPVSLPRKSGGTNFKTTQLPIRGGEVWSQGT